MLPKKCQENCQILQFPNAVVLNAVGRRNTQMHAKEHKIERKRKSAKERKRAQKEAKERLELPADARREHMT